ncbi:Protein of unknown function [Pyronema omphalodes CBS 100304]|uniref:Uncharacterized protein n=1 Tax=Pyronema omphalodes (strain CBS 100304) TaxID=1076935 RepID=U4LNB0_PYROM|nr:Protein of unknown function [Pyronema omphalodes CBS 100304]
MKLSLILSAVFAAAAIASAIPEAEAAPAPEIEKRDCYTTSCGGEGCKAGYTVKNIVYCNQRFGIIRRICCN